MREEVSYRERKEKRKDLIAILVIGLMAALAAVMTALFVTARSRAAKSEAQYRALAENTYRKSYYALLYNMDGLDSATNKLTVASGKAIRQEYLADISSYATAAGENMANFTPEENEDSKILKFINQTGDFAKYLDDKLNKGGNLSEEDSRTIGEIASAVREIKSTLANLGDEVEAGDFSFVDSLKRKDGAFVDTLRSFEKKEIDYPSMIYDGPFSDSLEVREGKALAGEEMDEEMAKAIASDLIKSSKPSDISVKSGSKNVFESYDVEADTAWGKAYLTIAKKGGFPVSVNFPEVTPSGTHIEAKDAELFAEKYLLSIGIREMKAVWASLYDNVYYINLAAVKEGVILYPDLIKVKVSGEDGRIVGMESLNYIYNHTERVMEPPVVTEQEAVEAISEYIELSSCRLTLVPTKGNGEALAYEFFGTKGEDKYFVYVDAATGEEMKIMRVLDGERGLLLQ